MSDDASDLALRQQRIETGLMVGVIVVPMLLVAVTWAQHEVVDYSYPVMLLFGSVRWLVEQGIATAIMIWLALRSPILGRRPFVATGLILMLVLMKSLSTYVMHSASTSQLPLVEIKLLPLFCVLSTVGELLVSVAGMIVVRRVFGLVLVARGEEVPTDRKPFSIMELMFWTALIAGYFGYRNNIMELVDYDAIGGVDYPWWAELFFLLSSILLVVGLTAAIIFAWRRSFWRQLPAIVVIFVLLTALYQYAVSYLYFGGGSIWDMVTIYESMSACFAVLVISLVVMAFHFVGYRFERIGRTLEVG